MKIIKVKSCFDCGLSYDQKLKIKCPMAGVISQSLPHTIYKTCPLDDYKENR